MMIEFNKAVFVQESLANMKKLGVTRQHLMDALEASDKTIDKYLNPKRPELPKLNKFTIWFQLLNTSPGRLLIGKGPDYIEPGSVDKLYDFMKMYSDPQKPDYFIIGHILTMMKLKDVKVLRRMLTIYAEEHNLM